MRRFLYGWPSLGTRPFTSEELGLIESRLARAENKLRSYRVWRVVWTMTLALSLVILPWSPGYGVTAIVISIFGLPLSWLGIRDFSRVTAAYHADLAVGRMEEFMGLEKEDEADVMPQLVTMGSGRLVRDLDGPVKALLFVDVSEVYDEGVQEKTFPAHLAELDGMVANKRRLSESELKELGRVSIRTSRIFLSILPAIYFTWGGIWQLIPDESTATEPLFGAIYLLFSLLFWYQFLCNCRLLRTAAQFRLDRRAGHVLVVKEERGLFEVLPHSRYIWRFENEPADWRTTLGEEPSGVPRNSAR